MRKNILFSTTRQWNPGDEFILMGVLNLLKEFIGDFNPVIYNRNPEVRQEANHFNLFRDSRYCNIGFKGKNILESFFRIGFWDNSFKDKMDLDFIDMVVFAGSPEWMGARLLPLYKKLLHSDKPIIYLGIGTGRYLAFKDIKAPFIDVLKKAQLITVRDSATYNLLKPLNPYLLPCPALFSSSYEKEIRETKKIGLIFATDKAVVNNKISTDTFKYITKLYDELIKKFNCELVCHYIEELPEAQKLFKDIEVHYSYDSKDYLEIYQQFDFVIGPRVHGIGMSASMGIPGILISHDLRGETGKGFLAEIVKVGEDIDYILENIDKQISEIVQLHEKLILHKKENKKIFLSLLKKHIHV
jgi:polysaccharide pyruvyl transferase WcaK-like protein